VGEEIFIFLKRVFILGYFLSIVSYERTIVGKNQ
jgi:hypothetical protein